MALLVTLCLVLALISFVLAAAGVAAKIGLEPLGLALLTLAWLLGRGLAGLG